MPAQLRPHATAPFSAAPPTRENNPPAGFAADETEDQLTRLLRTGDFRALLALASSLPDSDLRSRWISACAELAPGPTLARFAVSLHPGSERDHLMARATERWLLVDPAALSEWASAHLDDDAELDRVLARLVEGTDELHRPSARALAWSGLIRDPVLRLAALRAVLREWSADDADAALRHVRTSAALSDPERLALLAQLAAPPLIDDEP